MILVIIFEKLTIQPHSFGPYFNYKIYYSAFVHFATYTVIV
jgi:hypothetical protein